MPDSLTIAEVVETLVNLDLVDLDSEGPWPGEPDDADAYEPDWNQVHPDERDATDMPMDMPESNWSVLDEVRTATSSGFQLPPADLIDALAWYTPVHYFGPGAAIYIREAAVVKVAISILSWLEPPARDEWNNIVGALRAAMSVLYLHEAFHHKIESLAIRYEIVEYERRYLPYHANVVIPLLRQQSNDVLEEALACAEMYRRFRDERVYRKGVPDVVRKATLQMLPQWFDTLPPSYNQAAGYLRDKPFDAALKILMSQVQEATTTPKRKPAEWNLVPHQIRGLFDCQRITHILVPVGERPVLPWIGHVPALPSVSTRKAIRHLEKIGYQVVPGRGRGSHVWLECEGRRPVNLPANHERLAPGLIKHIAEALGLRVADLRI